MDKLNDWMIQLGLAIFAGFVWLLRLEAKNNQNSKDIARHDEDIRELRIVHTKISNDLTAIRESTAQIKGYLSMPERDKP